MLRVHFTDRDLARTVVTSTPDPLWETVLGIHQVGRGAAVLGGWRRRARADILARRLSAPLRFLHALAGPSTYFPDFLTPAEAAGGLRCGLAAIRGTSAARLHTELTLTARARALPSWAGALARADRCALDELVDALWLAHDVLVAPYRDEVDAVLDPERQRRARAVLTGGVDGLLGSLQPDLFEWRAPVLSSAYPRNADLYLNGRGIRLIPSYFCVRQPVVLADPELTPVLVYPVARDDGWLTARTGRPEALGALLGSTRAEVLRRVGVGANTGEVARRAGIAAASASEHLTALREAGLVRSRRAGQRVRHELTELGEALLRGEC